MKVGLRHGILPVACSPRHCASTQMLLQLREPDVRHLRSLLGAIVGTSDCTLYSGGQSHGTEYVVQLPSLFILPRRREHGAFTAFTFPYTASFGHWFQTEPIHSSACRFSRLPAGFASGEDVLPLTSCSLPPCPGFLLPVRRRGHAKVNDG